MSRGPQKATDDPSVHTLQRSQGIVIQCNNISGIAEVADAQTERLDLAVVLVEDADGEAGGFDDVAGSDYCASRTGR
jgi:hypothetical protein